MKRILISIFLAAAALLSVWQFPGSSSAQQKSLTLAQVLTALQTQGKTAETKTLAARNKYIAARVRQLKVSFSLTSEREQDLREAGATDELIQAIRQNSPGLPTPSQTPVVRSTPGPRELKNSIGMEFTRIPAGSFTMGSPASEASRVPNETQRQVRISRDFYMGKFEVTQAQWKAIMGDNPSRNSNCGGNCPVEQVSWNDAQAFIRKLNAMYEGTYRLPTEAEWEYAARAGTTTAFAFGNSLSSDRANIDGNYPYGGAGKGVYLARITPVGSYRPNDWGVYDMHGNVREWCHDWYGDYPSSSETDPQGPASGTSRVGRGGAWVSEGKDVRSAARLYYLPEEKMSYVGFRLVRE